MSRTTFELAREGVGLLRMDRPDALNAIDMAMLDEMIGHLEAARDDPEVRVIVISSTDHTAFSAGADLKEELDRSGKVERMQRFADLYDLVVGHPKPTLAACHGYTVGGGAEIAVGCDIRIGGSNLQMRFPGAALGVPVGAARLVTLCGLGPAKYLLLASPTIKADEALRIGLISRVAPGAATEETTLELAGRMAEFDPASVGRLKRMLHQWDDIEGRSAEEGRGQVTWQDEGPGLG